MKKLLLYSLIVGILSCKKETNPISTYQTTPYEFPKNTGFRKVPQQPDNPVTIEGVTLGKKLFFDTILSQNYTLSCASCHNPENSFSDNKQFSLGVGGVVGTRNAMPLINLAWSKAFFWDGRSSTLQEQALVPVPKEDEMHLPWAEAVQRLNKNPDYKALFKKAFNANNITDDLVVKAIEQYEMTLISYNSPYDKFNRMESTLNESALRGLFIFNSEKGDCFHCHNLSMPELFVRADIFSNNGRFEVSTITDFPDKGLGAITKNPEDYGKFKIPTLRNLAFTAPYMHDGAFATLDEVIEMYNQGPKFSPTLDTIMIVESNRRLEQTGTRALNLTPQEKQDLKNFLLSLSDSSFLKQNRE